MKVVWTLKSATVREVHQQLNAVRPIAYTTVLTMLRILEQKGHLRKTQVERAFVYRPAKPRHQVIGGMVREFVDRVFDGASRPLLAHLVSAGKLTDEDREELRRLIDEARS